MAKLSKYGVSYRETILTECLGTILKMILASFVDWILSFAPTVHITAVAAFVVYETATRLSESKYLEALLVIPWSMFSRQLNHLLSSKAYMTLQTAYPVWYWVASSTFRYYLLLDGPAEAILLEWKFDMLRAVTSLMFIALYFKGREFLQLIIDSRTAYGLTTTQTFCALLVAISITSLVFIHGRGWLTRVWYRILRIEGSWLEARSKAYHSVKNHLYSFIDAIHRILLDEARGISTFIYDEPLDEGHIRLLRLRRRIPLFGLIKAELTRHHLQDSNVKFEALSYTWDTSDSKNEGSKLIMLNGQRFSLTSNLHSLLRSRSSLFWERTIWVDAICINQGDVDEKSRQIRLMTKIYTKCDRTIAWLRDPFDASLAVYMIRNIVESWEMYDRSSQETFISLIPKALRPGWRAIARLLTNSYFSRVWIYQEVMLGNNFQFYIGGHYISFEYLNKAISAVNAVDADFSVSISDGNPVETWSYRSLASLRRHCGDAYSPPLVALLSKSAGFLKATDPRDKIYGFLGIANDQAAKKITESTDYKKSIEAVFTEAASYLLNPSEDYCASPELAPLVLSHAGIGFGGDRKGLPSWVPDWTNQSSMRRILNLLEYSFAGDEDINRMARRQGRSIINIDKMKYAAGGKDDFLVKIDRQDWTMTVDALYVDSISSIGEHFEIGYTAADMDDWVCRSLMEFQSYDIRIPEGQSKSEVFLRSLAADWADSEYPVNPEFYTWTKTWLRSKIEKITSVRVAESLSRLLDEQNSPSGDVSSETVIQSGLHTLASRNHLNNVKTRITDACRDRRFSITKSRRLCLVPPGSTKGDIVCVIRGVQTPFVIRRAVEDASKLSHQDGGAYDSNIMISNSLAVGEYVLVGECYVHGIMNGEAIDDEFQELVLV
jgi:hypothetical protein